MVASLAVLASFVFLVLTLDRGSGYADSLLPAFIMRGLGIGLFMSASSYAVVTAVPLAKSGLASGTLTMARQIGTSIGVALFGAVYLHSLSADLEGHLANLPPAEAAAIEASAEHFVATGDGTVFAAVEGSIVDGFVFISAVGVGIAAFAMAAALTMRAREKPALVRRLPGAGVPAPARGEAGGGGR
jgi:hypothetical protein